MVVILDRAVGWTQATIKGGGSVEGVPDAIGWAFLAGLALVTVVAFHDAPQRLVRAHREGRVTRDARYHAANAASIVVLAAWLAALWAGLDRGWLPSGPSGTAARWGGLLVALSGAGFAVAARLALSDAFAPTAARPPDGEVVERGPYAVVRHPFYVGLIVALVGGTLALDSLATAAVAAVLAPIVREIGVREEAQLVEELGQAYEAYRDRVPRWWPRWPDR